MEQAICQQARRLGLDPADDAARSQAIDALAKTLAAKRGTTPIPRRSRVRADDRAHAVALMIRVFGLGEAIDGTPAEAATVERVMGIAPNGRRNTIADSRAMANRAGRRPVRRRDHSGLPNLLNTVADATDADLATARQTVIALVPVPAPDGPHDRRHVRGRELHRARPLQPDWTSIRNPSSSSFPWCSPCCRAGWNENLDAVTSALRQTPEMAAQISAS